VVVILILYLSNIGGLIMSSYIKSLSTEFKDWKRAVLIVIFTVARLIYGFSWLHGGIKKLPWLTDGKINSASLINVAVKNLETATTKNGADPLHLNDMLVWAAKHIFLATPILTDYMVVFSEIAIGIVIILGFKIIWIALLGMFLNTQYFTAGSANNFGYVWTNLGLMGFAKYTEAIGISGYLKARKGKELIGDKLIPWLNWP
jgi:thiosulfate dehydrogenase (quinone) large subunit